MPKKKPLTFLVLVDEQEMDRRMAEQIATAQEMRKLAREIRKQAIEMREASLSGNSRIRNQKF
jgi:hypothetical protein